MRVVEDESGNEIKYYQLVPIPLRTTANPEGFGTGHVFLNRQFNCACGKKTKYSYAELTIDDDVEWEVEHGVSWPDGVADKLTWTRADNLRWWEYYYRDYKKLDSEGNETETGSLDYSQNCYGYAFGTGNWLIDIKGFYSTCTERATVETAEFVVDSLHAAKVKGKKILPRDKDAQIVHSSEQYRESGTYAQDEEERPFVDVTFAHRRSAEEFGFGFLFNANAKRKMKANPAGAGTGGTGQ